MQNHEKKQTLTALEYFHRKLQTIAGQGGFDFATISDLSIYLANDFFAVYRYIDNLEEFRLTPPPKVEKSKQFGIIIPNEFPDLKSSITVNVSILTTIYLTLLDNVIEMYPKKANGENQYNLIVLNKIFSAVSRLNLSQEARDEILDRRLGNDRDRRPVYKNGQVDIDHQSKLAIKEVLETLEAIVKNLAVENINYIKVLPKDFSLNEFQTQTKKALAYLFHKIKSLEIEGLGWPVLYIDPNRNLNRDLYRIDVVKQRQELILDLQRMKKLIIALMPPLEEVKKRLKDGCIGDGTIPVAETLEMLTGLDINRLNGKFHQNSLIMRNLVDDKLHAVNIALDVLTRIETYRSFRDSNGNSGERPKFEFEVAYASLFLALPEEMWEYFLDLEYNDTKCDTLVNKRPLRDFLEQNVDLTSERYRNFCEFAYARHPSLDFESPLTDLEFVDKILIEDLERNLNQPNAMIPSSFSLNPN